VLRQIQSPEDAAGLVGFLATAPAGSCTNA
jgi:hypothetical protein